MRGDKDFSKKVFARGEAIITFTLKQLRTRIGGCGGEHDCHLICSIYMKDYRPNLLPAYKVILVDGTSYRPRNPQPNLSDFTGVCCSKGEAPGQLLRFEIRLGIEKMVNGAGLEPAASP